MKCNTVSYFLSTKFIFVDHFDVIVTVSDGSWWEKASLEYILKTKKFMINHKLFLYVIFFMFKTAHKLSFYSNQVHLTKVWVPQLLVILLMFTNPKRLRWVVSQFTQHHSDFCNSDFNLILGTRTSDKDYERPHWKGWIGRPSNC